MSTLVRFGNAVGALAIVGTLLAAFVFQFALHELPCPLCMLQRVALALCGVGYVLNLRLGSQPMHYGLILLSALFGLAASGRHLALHILPGDKGFGSPVLGLHLYTWTLLFFLATIAGVAVLLLLQTSERAERWIGHRPERHAAGTLSRLVCWLLILVVLGNAVASFVQCGPIECSDNPTSYWLLRR
ncbi:MAG TPA: disulfide bond formation protein B [Reyranella sp.]|nr:disulfide bond formation protein B [Reyranella sp.]